MVVPILGMVVATLVEKKRLILAEKEKGGNTSFFSMSVFWLDP